MRVAALRCLNGRQWWPHCSTDLQTVPPNPDLASHHPLQLQVGSHYHFVETNPLLFFDRQLAYGYRLNILPGTAVRFEVGGQASIAGTANPTKHASSLHSSSLNLTLP